MTEGDKNEALQADLKQVCFAWHGNRKEGSSGDPTQVCSINRILVTTLKEKIFCCSAIRQLAIIAWEGQAINYSPLDLGSICCNS